MTDTLRDRAPHPDVLVSVAQAASLLGVHPNTIRAWTDAGRLTAYRINARGDRRFRRSDVELLLGEGGPAEGNGESASDAHGPAERVLRAISRVARGAGSADSAILVCRVAVEAVRTELGWARAAIYLAGPEGPALATHAGHDAPPPQQRPGDAAERDEVDGAGWRTVEIPIRHGAETYGLLCLADEGQHGDAALLRSLADTIASALRNARALAGARRELRRSRALRAITHELTGQLDLPSVLDDVVERTRSLFGADRAGVWLVHDREFPFSLAAHRGLSEEFISSILALRLDSEALGVRAVVERRALWMSDVSGANSPSVLRDAYAREGIRTTCVAPLIGRDEPLGVIGLYHSSDHLWPDEEVALLQAFANQAAVAIQNARLYSSVNDRTARLQSIQDLSVRLNRLTDVTAIAEAIVAEASALADYHDIRVYQVDWERRVCEPLAFTREMLGDDPGDAAALLRTEIGEGFTGWVAEHGEAQLINNAVDDPRGKTIEGTDDVPESMLLVPMLYEGRALGVIVLSQLGYDRFTGDDLQTMSIFAGQAAQAMANAAAYAQLAEQSEELARQLNSQRRLLEINERLSSLDQQAVLESIADGLHSVVAYDNLSVWRVDRTARRLVPIHARDAYADEIMRHTVPFGRGLMSWAVEHAEPVLANDALSDPRTVQIPGTPAEPEAVIFVPLEADGEVIGAMNVGRLGGDEAHFSAADFELVKLFAAQAAIALRNADTHHAVSQRAETDALTGLANHGAFQRDLGAMLDEGGGQRRVSMLMMDLDGFKPYNDRHGHPAGDALLHAVATAIYGAARSEDRVYRYGGDEFAMILPDTSIADAARAGERIRRAVARLTAPNAPVTITVGVAATPRDARDRPGLIAAADTALYYGKHLGEDRVVRVSDVPAEIRGLRGRLDDLARAALRGNDEAETVGQIVEQAVRLAGDDGEGAPRLDNLTDAVLAVARSVGDRETASRGHDERVGRLAASVAGRLGLPDDETRAIELAGRLHALGETAAAAVESVSALRPVARHIRSATAIGKARTGSGGRPARASLAAQVVAAADAYDALVTGRGGRRLGRKAALASLRSRPAGIKARVIDALGEAVAARPDRGRRRRRADTSTAGTSAA